MRGSGPQTDKHLPQSPFTGQFCSRNVNISSIFIITSIKWNYSSLFKSYILGLYNIESLLIEGNSFEK